MSVRKLAEGKGENSSAEGTQCTFIKGSRSFPPFEKCATLNSLGYLKHTKLLLCYRLIEYSEFFISIWLRRYLSSPPLVINTSIPAIEHLPSLLFLNHVKATRKRNRNERSHNRLNIRHFSSTLFYILSQIVCPPADPDTSKSWRVGKCISYSAWTTNNF